MRAAELALLYALVGAGAAAATLAYWRVLKPNIIDIVIVLAFWPLYGPFLLMRAPRSNAPLEGILPGEDAVRALEGRVYAAREKIAEIDRILERPEFSEHAARARHKALTERGDHRAATAVAARLQNIQRLAELRERFRTELIEAEELMGQLQVQSELVRLAGPSGAEHDALVHEVIARVESLDAMLDLDPSLTSRRDPV